MISNNIAAKIDPAVFTLSPLLFIPPYPKLNTLFPEILS